MSDEKNETSNTEHSSSQQPENLSVPQKTAGEGRNEQGQWIKGVSGNPEGSKPLTEEEKKLRKATKEYIEEYKEKLAEALPQISPILIAKALEGDIQAIKEINDRVIGKPKQPITGGDETDEPIKITGINYIKPNGNNSSSDNQTRPSVSSPE